MNREDRDGLSRDADINAQHRVRRRGAAYDEAAMAPYRRPVQAETGKTGTDFRRPGQPEEEKIDFRKPTMPAEKEIPRQARDDMETRDDAGISDDAGIREDPETEKTAAGISVEETRRLDVTGSIAEAAKDEDEGTDSRNGSSLGSRADSRVPEEARRMAAAPYGTGRPEPRRPGTRPMVAQPRPVQPAKPGIRASESGASAQPERANGRALARELRRQSAVGYAPGRMTEGNTRKIPSQAEIREEAENEEYAYSGNREARAYLERRGQPFREKAAPEPAARPASRGLKMLVIALLLAGAALTEAKT